MVRFAGWILVAVMAGVGVAHASKHEQWNAVERLGVGIPVEVRSVGQAGVEECRVVRVDDAALTCQREPDPNANWGPGDNARLVFPRSAVREVRMRVVAPDRHMVRWILGGAAFALGVDIMVEGNIVFMAIYGVVFWDVKMVQQMGPHPMPRRPPAPPRMRWQLVYRSATP